MSQPEQEWIEIEFETLDLNDKRLDKRAEKIVRDFSAKPTASIPEFSESWAATKAVYDFCANEKVAAAQIVQAQRQATQARMKEYAFVLGLQDTTEINLSHYPATEGTGTLSSVYSQGFLAHSTFVVTAEGLPLGLLAQECWVREEPVSAQSKAQVERPIEEKESYKWLKALTESTAELPATTQMLVVSDRESDIMEYFLHPRPSQVELLLRSSQDRRIEGSEWLLWQTVKRGPVQGLITVEVDAKPPQPARTATCQVRFQPVTVRPPKNRPASLPTLKSVKLWAILLEEMDVPEGVKPLAWRLLTTMAVTTFDDACRMIEFYTLRWLIERFHFVLKSGCRIEERRLGSVSALQRFLALANVVAWRLLYLTYAARIDADLPCTVALQPVEWQALYGFIHKTQRIPISPPSLQQATLWIAKLGGFLARKGDGEPGLKVLWRGWQRLSDLVQTWLIFNPV
jgi:transposase-like protein/transposase Tn5 family protein